MIRIHEAYKPILQDIGHRYILISGGRGSGKSFFINLFLCNLTFERGHRILFTRWTMESAYISIIPEFLDKIELLNVTKSFAANKDEIINTRTGNQILFRGIKTSQGTQTAKLKSLPGITTWVLDEAEELVDEDVFDTIDLSVRKKGTQNRVIMIMNPTNKNHFIYKRFIKDTHRIEEQSGAMIEVSTHPDVLHIHVNYDANIENLDESWVKGALRTKELNLKKYQHKYLGAWIDNIDGALWTPALIQKHRAEVPEHLRRIVVAIDPAVSSEKHSDDTGIIIAGVDYNNDVYIIADLTGKYTPNEWARVAVHQYEQHRADAIIAEKNNGGDLVDVNIRTVNRYANVKLVWASKGKATRAEPVVSMYEQGKVHHVGTLAKLEDELTTWVPDSGMPSPNRLDALVWAVTELLLNNNDNIEWQCA